MTLVIDNIGELVTNAPELGAGPLGIVRDAAIVVDGDTVLSIGPAGASADERLDAGGRCVLPGFVDSHTHLVFAGDRAEEFTRRMAGENYDGGGIRVTTEATRGAGRETLRTGLDRRLTEVHRAGTTTVEIKSGYGLSVESEAETTSLAAEVTSETTFMGAHVVPREYLGRTDDYVDLVCGPMLEAVRPHVRWIDVFCEEGAFDVDQSRAVLEAGRAAGLGLRLHANQLGHGPGVRLGVEMGCASVDHCTYLSDDDIEALAGSETVATFLPAADFSTRQPYPDARRVIDAGVTVAIASNCNPGSSYTHFHVVLHRAGGTRHEHDHRRSTGRGNDRRRSSSEKEGCWAPRPRWPGPPHHHRRTQPPPPRLPTGRSADMADARRRLPTTGHRPPKPRERGHSMNVPNPTGHNQWYPFANRPLPPDVNGEAANPAAIPIFDPAPLPRSARFVVVGAGIHGLSSAYHLAMYLERSGKGKGSDVVLIDKQGPGAGATGLACGCVRNLYMTPPLHAILRASVEVWESDPVNLGFQQVGYVSVGEANQEEDYIKLQASQAASGYPSDLYAGSDAHAFLNKLWPDFKTDNCDIVLHEHRSGYAGTHIAVWGLDQKCRQWGVQRVYGTSVTGYARDASGSVTAVETDHGSISCEQVVVGAGAWTPVHWEWLGGPSHLDVLYPDGHVEEQMDMWTYWRLLEGEVLLPEGVDFRTAQHRDSPVLHVELMDTPVYGEDGAMILDNFYVYTRYAAERVGAPGLQGGTIPIKIGPRAALEPYGHLNDMYQADSWFADYYCAALGMLFKRLENLRPYFKERRNGGIGAFTPDNVPVFDHLTDNAWVIADSNHGFKMIGVGKLTAQMLVHGDKPDELKPFTLGRYSTGGTFGDRNSNSPWV